MQAFTYGDVTVRVEISSMQPHVGNMMIGYYCEFVWWLEIDGVEYVSGETAWHEDWHTGNADGAEGWDRVTLLELVDTDYDAGIEGALEDVAEQVLDWFGNLREDIVGAWMNTVNEYVERANEYGDGRTDRNQYAAEYRAKLMGVDVSSGAAAWCIVDGSGEPLEFGDWYDSKELAVRAISIMQHA
jgi:hypothetical protein